MVRAVLRSRSGDIVSVVKLADRTGIVAASAPPPVEPEPAPAAPLVYAPSPPRRRGGRNVLFGCAAALLLLIGWVAGGTFGHHDPAPAVASSPVADQVPPDASGPGDVPPATSEPPQPAVAAPAPVVQKTSPKRTTAQKQSATPAATAQSDSSQARSEPVVSVSVDDQTDVVNAEYQRILEYWAAITAQNHGNTDGNGHGWGGR